MKIKYKIFSVFLVIILINTFCNAKYVIENQFEIANLNIDRTKPEIELVNTHSTNSGGKSMIGITVKFMDKHLENVFCDKEHVKIKNGDNYMDAEEMKFILINDTQEEKVYQIQFKNKESNNDLMVEFLEGVAIDKSKLQNNGVAFDINL